MKILYLSSVLSIHDYRLLKSLSDSSHQVYLITHYAGDALPQSIVDLKGIEIINYDNSLAFSAGAEKYSRLTRKIRCWFAFAKSWLRLRRDIKRLKPDVIHAGWTDAEGFLVATLGLRSFLLMTWGSDILVVPKLSKKLKLKTQFTLRRADLIWSDCQSVKNEIIKLIDCPPEKVVVFPRGVDLRIFNPRAKVNTLRQKLGWQDKKIIIMTRSFKEVYGVEYFIRALPQIISQCPDARVILAGDGPLKVKFTAMLEKYGLSDFVHFAGYVKNEELATYYNSADLYVSSSLSDGTSNALLEAMACGLPMVLSDVPSYFEWATDQENVYFVSRKNHEQLAEKIIKLLKDDKLRQLFAQRNLAIAQSRANWDQHFSKLEQIYGDLASKYQ